MPQVFISHSSQDREVVEREIIFPLRAHGVDVWYSRENIKSASEWERQIREGLRACDWFLVALSPRSVASEWVQREVHWAFIKRKGKIVPVMLETCEPEDIHLGLLPIQFIDFRNGAAQSLERLLAIWGVDVSTQIKNRYRAAQDAMAEGDWGLAVEHLKEVLRLDPSHAQAQADLYHARQQREVPLIYEAGVTHLRANRWREALETLQHLSEVNSHYKDVDELMALAEAELDKAEAERLYREATEAMSRESWGMAVEQFQAVLKLSPSHTGAQDGLNRAIQQKELAELYAAGLAHLQAERWREALKNFRRVRSIDRSYRGVGDLIADADAGLEEEETQHAETEKQERESKEEAERQARDTQNRTATEVRRSTDEKAARVKGKAKSLLTENPGRGMKNTLVKVLTTLAGVIGLFIIVWALLGPKLTSTEAAEHNSKAEVLLEQKKYAEAEAEYRKAVELVPDEATYHSGLGIAMHNQKKYAEAEVEYRKAIELNPNIGGYHNNLGIAMHHQNKYAEAEVEYRRAMELNPSDGSYHYNLGLALAVQKKLGEAEVEFRKAIGLDPNNANYHVVLALNLHDQNRHEEEEVENRKALQIDPNNKFAEQNLKRK
jgi:tetratricopeptide (TPR) repeat protein